jgi:hypothetical protein
VQPVKVQLVDGSVRLVEVDLSKPVAENTESVCAKLGVATSEGFRLCFLEDDGKRRWLKSSETLVEQGYSSERELLFCPFSMPAAPSPSEREAERVQLKLAFEQCSQTFLSGDWPLNEEEEATSRAAELLQATRGDFRESKV